MLPRRLPRYDELCSSLLTMFPRTRNGRGRPWIPWLLWAELRTGDAHAGRVRRVAITRTRAAQMSGEYSTTRSLDRIVELWLTPDWVDHMDIYESTSVSHWKTG